MAHYSVGTARNSSGGFEIRTIDFKEVKENDLLKQRLEKIIENITNNAGIEIKEYIKNITMVYEKPEPEGFDFQSTNPALLLKLVEHNKKFHHDDPKDAYGALMSLVTIGEGFRQIGAGPSIHIEIEVKTNECNVHLDSHGFVDESGYNCDRMLAHGVWDLGPGKIPWLYRQVGGMTLAPYLAVNLPLDLPYFGKLPEFSSLPSSLTRYSSKTYLDLGIGMRTGGFEVGLSKRFDSTSGPINKYAEVRAAYYFSKGPLAGRAFGVIDTTGKWEGQADASLSTGRLSLGVAGRVGNSNENELQFRGAIMRSPIGDISAQFDPLAKSGSILIDLTGLVSP